VKDAENIAVVGREIDAVSLTVLLKKNNMRHKVTLITDTELPGFFRSKLPLFLVDKISLKDLILYEKKFLEKILLIKIEKVDNLETLSLKKISSEYDRVYIASITTPSIKEDKFIHLSKPETAIKLKQLINKKNNAEINVYGDLWGIWIADVLSKNGYNVTLCISNDNFYQEYFDEEIWRIIVNESNLLFNTKRINPKETNSDIFIISGFELPLVKYPEKLPDNVITYGSSSFSKDILLGKNFFHLSENLSIIQARMSILRMLGFHTFGYTRFFLSKIGKFFIASIGYNKKTLENYNIKTSSTRIRIPILENGKYSEEDIVIKAVADKYSRRVLGFQIISSSILALSYAEYAYALLLLGNPLNNLQLLITAFIPGEKFFYNPINKVLNTLWTKTLEYG